MALNRKITPELKALLEQQAEMQRQIKAAEQQQETKEAVARTAASKNGAGYAGLVLDLCELLDLEPEYPRIRKGRGAAAVEIPTDPTDEQRLARLRDMLEAIIEAGDPALLERLKLADEAGRDERREKRGDGKHSKQATSPSAGNATTDEDSDDADNAAITGADHADADNAQALVGAPSA